jgi:peptide deformylase
MAEPFKLVDTYLKQKTVPFDFENPPIDPKELYDRMAATMIKHKGLGLSCNQVGLQYSMFVFGNPSEPESIVGAFNPKIVDFSSGLEYGEEGCLSFPGLFIKVKRPTEIRASSPF